VALGATAARALAGRPLAIGETRGRLFDLAPGLPGLVTVHPSSLLRVPDPEAKRLAYAAFVKDLAIAADALTLTG